MKTLNRIYFVLVVHLWAKPEDEPQGIASSLAGKRLEKG
jgi:hypothetical protein